MYGNYGEHSNTNMINEAIRTGKIERTPDIDEEIIIDKNGRMNVDWNNPNIYKASIPIIFGLNSTRDE